MHRSWLPVGAIKGVARATYLGCLRSPTGKPKLPVGLLNATDTATTAAETCRHKQKRQHGQKRTETGCWRVHVWLLLRWAGERGTATRQRRGECNGHSSRTDRLLTMRRAVPMGDTPRKALSASVGSSSVTQCQWCGFVRAHLVSVALHHANVIFSPTRLPRQPMPPNSSTRARWNRLEQPELASQTAVRSVKVVAEFQGENCYRIVGLARVFQRWIPESD
eukprot:COSAG02_NODE_2128_length_9740_cov_20.436833_4_plen_221_part_00